MGVVELVGRDARDQTDLLGHHGRRRDVLHGALRQLLRLLEAGARLRLLERVLRLAQERVLELAREVHAVGDHARVCHQVAR
eukprot:2648807-Rhodomonas_salina.1